MMRLLLATVVLAAGSSCTNRCVATGFIWTSAACAASPCTAGCRFTRATGGTCPGGLIAIDGNSLASCIYFCGFYSAMGDGGSFGGGCWHYDKQLPGACQQPTCGWNQSCVVYDSTFEANQAIVCGVGQVCDEGRIVEDGSTGPCDLRPSD
jgi:hypothetical protein